MKKLLVTLLILSFPATSFAAIARNSNLGAAGGSDTNPIISSLSVSGTDGFILVAILLELTSETVSGVNYDDGAGGGAQAFTLIGSLQDVEAGNFRIYLWRLVAPTAGAGRRIIATKSGSGSWRIGASFYTGVDQTTPITDVTQNNDTSSPGSQLNTSNLDGSWQIGIFNSPNGGGTVDSGGAFTQQVSVTSGVGHLLDSNATVASGATNTFSWSWTNTHNAGWITAMLRPSVAVTPFSNQDLIVMMDD